MKKIAKTALSMAVTLGLGSAAFAQVPPSTPTKPITPSAPTAPSTVTPAAPSAPKAPLAPNAPSTSKAPVAPKADAHDKHKVKSSDKAEVVNPSPSNSAAPSSKPLK